MSTNTRLPHGRCLAPWRWCWCGLLALLPLAGFAGEKLIGTKPPEWQVTDWLNSKPLQLRQLRGKVVLVRWWTAPDCRYCSASAPALNEFHRSYRGRGLEVVGIYHHKSSAPFRLEDVRQHAARLGFGFPLAVDPDWRTLKLWWLDTGDRAWTSVSFLLDRQGVIRHIHPGGQYVNGDPDYAELKAKIEALLAEK